MAESQKRDKRGHGRGVSNGRMMAVVTGASGFLGSSLRIGLEQYGVGSIAIGAGCRSMPPPIRCRWIFDELLSALRRSRVEVVFHLAGSGAPYYNSADPSEHVWANLQTTKEVVKAIEAARFPGRVVFSSSASVYGNSGADAVSEGSALRPCSEYGRAKLLAEDCLIDRLSNQCALRVARIFNVVGPGQRKLVVYDLAKQILAGDRPLVVRGSGDELRDFLFVDDVIRALLFLGFELDSESFPLIVNVCSGRPTRLSDLARLLLRLSDRDANDLLFSGKSSINPVDACVGNPGRLASLGMSLPAISDKQFADTLSWIQNGGFA